MASIAAERGDERALVDEDWTLDPLEPAGAAELYRRVAEARPHTD